MATLPFISIPTKSVSYNSSPFFPYKGKIEKALGNEKYQFNDGTGTIVVEIDDDEWNGLTVKPEMTVQISGEIDKELMQTPEVDVEAIVLAQ